MLDEYERNVCRDFAHVTRPDTETLQNRTGSLGFSNLLYIQALFDPRTWFSLVVPSNSLDILIQAQPYEIGDQSPM